MPKYFFFSVQYKNSVFKNSHNSCSQTTKKNKFIMRRCIINISLRSRYQSSSCSSCHKNTNTCLALVYSSSQRNMNQMHPLGWALICSVSRTQSLQLIRYLPLRCIDTGFRTAAIDSTPHFRPIDNSKWYWQGCPVSKGTVRLLGYDVLHLTPRIDMTDQNYTHTYKRALTAQHQAWTLMLLGYLWEHTLWEAHVPEIYGELKKLEDCT